MNNHVAIEFACSEDEISMCQAVIALGANYKTNGMRISLFYELESMRNLGGEFLMLKIGGNIAGAALLSPRCYNGKEYNVVRLMRISVHPIVRRLGYAQKMIRYICETYPKVDAASENECGFKLLKKSMPYKKKIQTPISLMQKTEEAKEKYAWVFSTFPPDFNNTENNHARGVLVDEAAAPIVVQHWIVFEQHLASRSVKNWWRAGE